MPDADRQTLPVAVEGRRARPEARAGADARRPDAHRRHGRRRRAGAGAGGGRASRRRGADEAVGLAGQRRAACRTRSQPSRIDEQRRTINVTAISVDEKRLENIDQRHRRHDQHLEQPDLRDAHGCTRRKGARAGSSRHPPSKPPTSVVASVRPRISSHILSTPCQDNNLRRNSRLTKARSPTCRGSASGTGRIAARSPAVPSCCPTSPPSRASTCAAGRRERARPICCGRAISSSRSTASLLAGGSAFGLEAASGVMRYLAERNIGFPFGRGVVPIVPAAILFDLGIGRHDRWPTIDAGYARSGERAPSHRRGQRRRRDGRDRRQGAGAGARDEGRSSAPPARRPCTA